MIARSPFLIIWFDRQKRGDKGASCVQAKNAACKYPDTLPSCPVRCITAIIAAMAKDGTCPATKLCEVGRLLISSRDVSDALRGAAESQRPES